MICPTKKIVSFKAKLLSGEISYSGFTDSICEDGLYIRTLPIESDIALTAGSAVKVRLEPEGKDALSLDCRVKWVYKTPPHKLTHSIGVEILNEMPNYKELLKELL